MLASLASLFHIETLAFQYNGALRTQPPRLGSARDEWFRASEGSIHFLFAYDPSRSRLFLHFFRAGFFGVFLVRGGRWVSYGWCTPPGIGRPPHLPRWAGKLSAFWIFYCHTREGFRCQGNYKRVLAQIVYLAGLRARHPLIFCDTLPDNFASRNALLQSGFTPAGVITSCRPFPGLFLRSRWERSQPHLPVLQELDLQRSAS